MSELLWTFQTANFKVSLIAHSEDSDPADHFDNDENVEFARHNGGSAWFSAEVRVERWDADSEDWEEVASDHLGGCSYETFKDFYAGHRDKDPMNRNSSIMRAEKGQNAVICHYFPDMVSTAIQNARAELEE